jgi:hypothetical protein
MHIHPKLQLSNNFYLYEAIRSHTAARQDIDNMPTDPQVVRNLGRVATQILQPARDHFGIPIIFDGGYSWYRCLRLNRALGSGDDSQHPMGEAVDFGIRSVPHPELATWIKNNLIFDQLILECWNPEDPVSGWVHVSLKEGVSNNRGEVLTYIKKPGKKGYFRNGLVF